MKQLLLICAVVALVGCGTTSNSPKAKVDYEGSFRKAANRDLGSFPLKLTGELTKADYEKVTRMNLHRRCPPDLSPLVNFTQLVYLHLKGCPATDLSPLANLTQLEYLDLGPAGFGPQFRGKITDITPLTNLTQLKELSLHHHQLTNVKGLEKLTQLESLGLGKNQLTSAKGLENLTQLTRLSLYSNRLKSVKGLENLTQLASLHLSNNQLTDVKGLEKLTQLKHLRLNDNPALTKAQIIELLKALPKCHIYSRYSDPRFPDPWGRIRIN